MNLCPPRLPSSPLDPPGLAGYTPLPLLLRVIKEGNPHIVEVGNLRVSERNTVTSIEVENYKISQLPGALTTADDDLVEVVIDTGTTLQSRKMNRSTLLSGKASQTSLTAHTSDINNPHPGTKTPEGFSNVPIPMLWYTNFLMSPLVCETDHQSGKSSQVRCLLCRSDHCCKCVKIFIQQKS